MTDVYEQLLKCPLFSSFTHDELEKVLTRDLFRIESYTKGQIIRHQGTQYDDLLVLIEGKVSARFHEYSGKTMLVETLSAPDPLAAAVLFSDVNYLPVTTEADNDVRIVAIRRKGVLTLFQKNAGMLQKFLREMGSKVIFLAEKVRLAGMANLRQKIADYLLRMRDQYSRNEFSIPYSREKMAELLSVARPSLSRELSRMAEEGLIAIDGRHVRILDPEELQNILVL